MYTLKVIAGLQICLVFRYALICSLHSHTYGEQYNELAKKFLFRAVQYYIELQNFHLFLFDS